jgi:hypothetical protein
MKQPSARPNLPAVSEEMKAWCAALAAEVSDWPQVSVRSFFGFTAVYRSDKMFAALPRTRGMETANSLAFKLESAIPAVRARLEKSLRTPTCMTLSTGWGKPTLRRAGIRNQNRCDTIVI